MIVINFMFHESSFVFCFILKAIFLVIFAFQPFFEHFLLPNYYVIKFNIFKIFYTL